MLTSLHDSLDISSLHPLTQVQGSPQKWPNDCGEDDCGGPATDKVDHEERKRGHCGEEELVPPAKVEHVVGKPEEGHAADTE